LEALSKNDTTSVFAPAAALHAQFPQLNQHGAQAYYYIYPHGMYGHFLHPDVAIPQIQQLWTPVLAGLENFPNMKKVIRVYQEFPTYKAWFDSVFGAQEEPKEGEDLQIEPPAPRGNVPMDSWLIGSKALQSSNLAAALAESMPKMEGGMLRGHLTAGGKVNDAASGAPLVNPAWRTALVHIIGTGSGQSNVTAIKRLEESSGSYSNEDSGSLERNWKRVMWGSKYGQLIKVKHSIDPKGVFWVSPGIAADEWRIVEGRLCKIRGVPALARKGDDRFFAPKSDNTNKGSGGNDYKPFPKSQEECDQKKKSCWF